MKRPGYHQFSHVPLAGSTMGQVFNSIVGVREEVVAPIKRPPHRLRRLVLLYTEAGEAINIAGDNRVVQTPGSIVVEPRGLVYADRTTKLPWRMRYLMLRGPLADEFQSRFWPTRTLRTYLYESPPPAWRKLLVELVEMTFDQPPGWTWHFLRRLGELFEDLQNCPPPERHGETLAEQVGRLISADVDRQWQVADLAAALRINPKSLTARFQKEIGQPPAAWVREFRMKLAVKFLHQGMSVIETANQLGFSDPSCFSRQFKAVMRVAPSTFHRTPPERH